MPTILLVEDDEFTRDVTLRRLRLRGFTVRVALDGEEACQAARAAPPDLILMDLGLPVLDGWEATRRLKGDPATRDIPVIALTAHAMVGDDVTALAAGCDDFATKPVDFDALLAKMEAVLNGGTRYA